MKERQRWQPEEDALLRAYVKQYGPKEWNLISQRMGKTIDRDPKSCLERWKNYLKPGIKKGPLTPEEQSLVVSLQSKYGNKWKKIAAEIPGRTAKRLGKWWEVFKEKQLQKQRQDYVTDPIPTGGSPETAIHGKYDHILQTFAEKFVQPKLLAVHQPVPLPAIMPSLISFPEPPTVLTLGSVTVTEPVNPSPPPPPATTSTAFPAWMNASAATTSSSTSTPSPSVSLTLSPTEPAVVDPVQQESTSSHSRIFPVHQMATLIQYCKDLEESKHNWLQHKKEATWRLNRLEQQLESEKSRKRKEKMEEIETKIKCLREEEMDFLGKIDGEYKDQLNALHRDAENKESKLLEVWNGKQVKLTKLVEQIGVHNYGFSHVLPKSFN